MRGTMAWLLAISPNVFLTTFELGFGFMTMPSLLECKTVVLNLSFHQQNYVFYDNIFISHATLVAIINIIDSYLLTL